MCVATLRRPNHPDTHTDTSSDDSDLLQWSVRRSDSMNNTDIDVDVGLVKRSSSITNRHGQQTFDKVVHLKRYNRPTLLLVHDNVHWRFVDKLPVELALRPTTIVQLLFSSLAAHINNWIWHAYVGVHEEWHLFVHGIAVASVYTYAIVQTVFEQERLILRNGVNNIQHDSRFKVDICTHV